MQQSQKEALFADLRDFQWKPAGLALTLCSGGLKMDLVLLENHFFVIHKGQKDDGPYFNLRLKVDEDIVTPQTLVSALANLIQTAKTNNVRIRFPVSHDRLCYRMQCLGMKWVGYLAQNSTQKKRKPVLVSQLKLDKWLKKSKNQKISDYVFEVNSTLPHYSMGQKTLTILDLALQESERMIFGVTMPDVEAFFAHDTPVKIDAVRTESLVLQHSHHSCTDFNGQKALSKNDLDLLFRETFFLDQIGKRATSCTAGVGNHQIFSFDFLNKKKGVVSRWSPEGQCHEVKVKLNLSYFQKIIFLQEEYLGASSFLILAIDMEKLFKKYGFRSRRFANIELGMILQMIQVGCKKRHWTYRVLGGFDDRALSQVLDTDLYLPIMLAVGKS